MEQCEKHYYLMADGHCNCSVTFPKVYVLGFMFSPDAKAVALIQKINPEWQRGLWNGIGGKLEEDELLIHAMCREFKEETGVSTVPFDWDPILTLGPAPEFEHPWKIQVYRAFTDKIGDVKTVEEEKVQIWNVDHLPEKKISNLKWMIPLCADQQLRNNLQLNIEEGRHEESEEQADV